MTASIGARVPALLTCSLKKGSQGVEAVALGFRRDQWKMNESRMVLANLEVPSIFEDLGQVFLMMVSVLGDAVSL